MKHHRLSLFIAFSVALAALSACGGEEAPKAQAGVPAAPAAPKAQSSKNAKAAAKAKAEEAIASVLVVPQGYRYEPRGRRDPFLNPIPKVSTDKEKEKVRDPREKMTTLRPRPDGLRGVLVSEARVGGIVVSKEPGMTKVLLIAPGKKTYFASRGDSLLDGVIKEIRPEEVVFTMISPDTRQPVTGVNGEATVRTGNSAGAAGEKK